MRALLICWLLMTSFCVQAQQIPPTTFYEGKEVFIYPEKQVYSPAITFNKKERKELGEGLHDIDFLVSVLSTERVMPVADSLPDGSYLLYYYPVKPKRWWKFSKQFSAKDSTRVAALFDMKANLVEGEVNWYDLSGERYLLQHYRKGMLHGVETRFQNGKKSRETNYLNDKMNGAYSSWNERGELIEVGQYVDGMRTGSWKSHPTKKPGLYMKEYNFTHKEEGSSANLHNPERDGLAIERFADGSLKRKTRFHLGDIRSDSLWNIHGVLMEYTHIRPASRTQEKAKVVVKYYVNQTETMRARIKSLPTLKSRKEIHYNTLGSEIFNLIIEEGDTTYFYVRPDEKLISTKYSDTLIYLGFMQMGAGQRIYKYKHYPTQKEFSKTVYIDGSLAIDSVQEFKRDDGILYSSNSLVDKNGNLVSWQPFVYEKNENGFYLKEALAEPVLMDEHGQPFTGTHTIYVVSEDLLPAELLVRKKGILIQYVSLPVISDRQVYGTRPMRKKPVECACNPYYKVWGKYQDSPVKFVANYIDGMRHGEAVAYDCESRQLYAQQFKDNELNGLSKRWEIRYVSEDGIMVRQPWGTKEQFKPFYYLEAVSPYENGELNGWVVNYNPHGNRIDSSLFINGDRMKDRTWLNGTRIEYIDYKKNSANQLIPFVQETYTVHNSTSDDDPVMPGDSLRLTLNIKIYRENGIRYYERYRRGVPNVSYTQKGLYLFGDCKFYYDDGTLQKSQTFDVADSCTYHREKKKFTFDYTENGSTKTLTEWREPLTCYEKNYYPNGGIASEGAIHISKRTGLWKFYDEAGQLFREIAYNENTFTSGTFTYNMSSVPVEIVHQGKLTRYHGNGTKAFESLILDESFSRDCNQDTRIAIQEHFYLNQWDEKGNQIINNGYGNAVDFDYYGRATGMGLVAAGIRQGTWQFYDSEGRLNGRGQYVNGEKQGRWLEGDLEGINALDAYCVNKNISQEEIEKLRKQIRVKEVWYKDDMVINTNYYYRDYNEH